MLRKLRYIFEYMLLRVVLALVDVLPFAVAAGFASFLADLYYCFNKKRRNIAIENVKLSGIAEDDKAAAAIARASIRHFAVLIIESIKADRFFDKGDWRDHVEMDIPDETKDLLNLLTQWQSQGKTRRIGAIINHFHVGMGSGAMVVWQVDPSRIEAVGLCLAGFDEVSHAYQRPTSPQWPYNLYTMVHGADPASTEQTVKRMSEACGVADYQRLLTEKELKKVPPTYIIPDNPMRQG